MKTKKIIITCILIGISICPLNLKAQTSSEYMPNFAPVSPNAASMGVFGSIPVGHYTGIPNINIPLYEIDLDGKTIPISLSYHASGIKVKQEASWVGLGWALNAGGSIIREMSGLDDFSGAGYCCSTTYPFNTNYNAATGQALYHFGEAIRKGEIDISPDLFYYNFANYIGSMFVHKSQSGNPPKVSFRRINEYLDAKVKLYSLALSDIRASWEMIDGQGYKYYFGSSKNSAEEHSLCSATIVWENNGNPQGPNPDIFNEISGPWGLSGDDIRKNSVIMTWHLDSIVSPLGHTIEFQYVSDTILTPYHKEERQSFRSSEIYSMQPEGSVTPYMPDTYRQESYSYAMIAQKLLKKIVFPSGTIEFQTSDRNDLFPYQVYYDEEKKSQKLEIMNIYDRNDNLIKSIQFDYSYLGNSSDSKTCRLLLEGITEKNENQTNASHRFDYNRGVLPPKYSKNIDHWGYYNNGINSYSWQRLSAFVPAPPNQGTLIPSMFVYEASNTGNVYFEQDFSGTRTPSIIYGADRSPNEETMKYGMLTSIQYPTGGKTRFVYEPHNFLNSFECGIEKEERTEIISINHVSFNTADSGRIVTFNLNETTDVRITQTVEVQWENESTHYHDYIGHYYDPEYQAGFILEPNEESPLSTYNEACWEVSGTCAGDPMFPKTYCSDNEHANSRNTIKSTFTSYQLPAGAYRMYILFNPDHDTVNPHWFSIKLETDPPIQKKIIDFGGGLRIKEIINTDNLNDTLTHKKFKYREGILMFPPLYGELLGLTACNSFCFCANYLSGSSSSIRSAIDRSYYQFSEIQVGYSEVEETDGINNGSTIRRFNNSMPPGFMLEYGINYFYPNSNGLLSKMTFYNNNIKEHSYFYSLQAKDTIVGFVFNRAPLPNNPSGGNVGNWHNYVYLLKYNMTSDWWKLTGETVTETMDNGAMEPTTTDYLHNDQNYLPTRITTNDSQNNSTAQIIRYASDYNNTEMIDKHLVNLPIETLSLYNNNVVKAVKTNYEYEYTGNNYLPKTIYSLNTTTPLPLNAYDQNYQLEVTFNEYNSKGKVLQLSTPGGEKMVYLWGYNNQYPVAEIKNATYSDVVNAIAGGQTTINTIAASNTPDISAIDNLRSHANLKDAMITTYTYKPLVGILSVTDPSGKKIFYEYDNFNRLKHIKDLDGNIIEGYDYHYKSEE